MRRHWKISKLVLAVLPVLVLFALKTDTANATNPSTISFQGKVVNANGTNVTDGTYTFLFKLYTVSSGGTAVWTETDSIAVTSGVFQVNLGANCSFFTAATCNNNTPINFGTNPNLYLGITFNSDPAGEMSPRVQLQSVPYAYNSDNLGGIAASSYAQLSPAAKQTGNINISGSLTAGGTITFGTGTGVLHSSSAGVITSSAVLLGTDTSGNYVASLGTLTGISASTSSGVGITPNLSVQYGSTVSTAVQGNTQITLTASTGLSGGGTLTLGSGGTDSFSVLYGSTAGTSVQGNTQVTLTAGTGLSGGGTLTLGSGGTDSFAVQYGSASGTATQGNVTFTCPTGTGNLSSSTGGNTITEGTGGTCSALNTVASPSFAGTVTAATGLTVTAGGAAISGNVTINGNLGFSSYLVAPAVTGTSGQGIYFQTTTPNNIASLQGLSTGTTSYGLLSVNKYFNGSAWVDDGQGELGSSLVLLNDTLTYYSFNTGNTYTPRLSVITGGDVGIGTAAPGYLLDVQGGDINASGNLRTGGVIRLDNAGNLSNIGTISASGAVTAGLYNGQTVSSAANFTGTETIAGLLTGNTGQTINGGAINLNANGNYAINIGTGTSTGAISIGGGSNALTINSSAFDVSSAGALSGITTISASGAVTAGLYNGQTITSAANLTGTLTVAGLLSGDSGVTINGGAINLNASSNFAVNIATGTSTGAISIGGGSNSFTLDSTALNVTSAGALSGITTISASGAVTAGLYNGQTITSAANFTGTINSTTGYKIAGTAGVTLATCANDDYANELGITDGIITHEDGCDGVGLSDERLKTDITSLSSTTLDEVAQLNPVNFYFDCSNPYFTESNTNCETNYQTGILAQQLMQIFPDLVSQDQYGYYHVDYQGLSVVTLKSVVQLAQFIDSSGDANFNNTTTNSLSVNGDTNITGALTVDGGTTINGSLNFDQFSANSASLSSGVITPSLVSNGALVINSGNNDNVAIGASGGSVSIGNGSSTTTIDGPLVTNGSTDDFGNLNLHFNSSSSSLDIDDAGASGAISSAITVTDTSGDGYNNVFSSPNFNVDGQGNISTGGSIVAKGGSFDLYGNNGNLVVSFDSSGDATFGGDLNLANASLSGGLTVGGNVDVAGLSTFQQLATFVAKTVFRQDVEFDGHITVASDTAGYASLRTGESTVHVTFQTAYQNPPVVTANVLNGQFGLVSVNNITDQGFDLVLSSAATTATTLDWTAVDVNSPQTATNPLPSQNQGSDTAGSVTGDGSSSPDLSSSP